jgi:hypothetical protein
VLDVEERLVTSGSLIEGLAASFVEGVRSSGTGSGRRDRRYVLVLAKHLPHHVGDFAEGRTRFHCCDYRQNEIRRPACGGLNCVQRRPAIQPDCATLEARAPALLAAARFGDRFETRRLLKATGLQTGSRRRRLPSLESIACCAMYAAS